MVLLHKYISSVSADGLVRVTFLCETRNTVQIDAMVSVADTKTALSRSKQITCTCTCISTGVRFTNRKVSQVRIQIMEWLSNYIHVKQWNVIPHPFPNYNGVTE